MKTIIYTLILSCISTIFFACEEVIDVDLEQGETLLVVDGKITNENKQHIIRLTTTAPYFDSNATPAVNGAVVTLNVYDANNILVDSDSLQEIGTSGNYATKTFSGNIDHKYVITIKAMNEEYQAESILRRIPPIDSITYKYKEAEGPFEAGYFIYYNGIEYEGLGDHYLFRVSRNGKEYSRPNQLYFASDELVDGNYIGDLDMTPEPFELGDTIFVQSFSMNADQYKFYLELSTQVNNGGIFASPPANVRTNIKNINPKGKKAVGYFSANGTEKRTILIQ